MATFVERIKSLFSDSQATTVPVSPSAFDDDDIVHLDAESLAEQGILFAYRNLLPRLQPYLSSPPNQVVEEVEDDPPRYVVHAGGKSYGIWDDDNLDKNGWERATVAFFDIVNANLEASETKFYAVYGGNDLSGVFLTGEQFAKSRRVFDNRSDWPWLPVDQPPYYGYPSA